MAGKKNSARRRGPSWGKTPSSFLTATTAINRADHIAKEMERKWGAGRLPLLPQIPLEMATRFQLQRQKYHRALEHGELEDVVRECQRMVNAYMALDASAEAAGASKLSPKVIEAVLGNGTVAAIVDDPDLFDHVPQTMDGRDIVVYGPEEIARLLEAYPALAAVKATFPGATIEAIRRPADPLWGLADTSLDLNDEIPDLGDRTFQAG